MKYKDLIKLKHKNRELLKLLEAKACIEQELNEVKDFIKDLSAVALSGDDFHRRLAWNEFFNMKAYRNDIQKTHDRICVEINNYLMEIHILVS